MVIKLEENFPSGSLYTCKQHINDTSIKTSHFFSRISLTASDEVAESKTEIRIDLHVDALLRAHSLIFFWYRIILSKTFCSGESVKII